MEEKQTPLQAAIKPGLTMGLAALAVTYLAYFIDSSLLASMWMLLVALVIFFGLLIYFGKEYRTELGGFMSFGVAFNFCFIAMLISGIVSLIGQILLFHVIDPSLAGVLADITFNKSLEMMASFGQDPDTLPPDALNEIRKSTADSFTIGGQLKSFGFGLIFYAIIALILAAILKKRDKSLDY